MQEKKADEKPPSSPRNQPTAERLRDTERSLKQEDKKPSGYLEAALAFLHRKR